MYGYLDNQNRDDLEDLLDEDLYEALQPPEERTDVDQAE
jgi:hypothetical protein